MDQSDGDDFDRIVDMEGELRSALANMNDSIEKHKKEIENISYLRNLLKKELKVGKDHIDNEIKLKVSSEVIGVVLSSQKQSKHKGRIIFKYGECLKIDK